MTLTEFLVRKTSVEHDQCKSCEYKTEEHDQCKPCKDKTEEETVRKMKFSSEEESRERARQSADRMVAIHEGIVEAAWESFKEKMDKIPADAKDVDKQVEVLFKGVMDASIKTASLGLIGQLLH